MDPCSTLKKAEKNKIRKSALAIQTFLLRQKNADAKQLFLYLHWQTANLCQQFFLLTLD